MKSYGTKKKEGKKKSEKRMGGMAHTEEIEKGITKKDQRKAARGVRDAELHGETKEKNVIRINKSNSPHRERH